MTAPLVPSRALAAVASGAPRLLCAPKVAGLLPSYAQTRPFWTVFSPDCWLRISDGDPRAFALYMRHYSSRNRKHAGNYKIAGPGEKMLLLSQCGRVLFGWRKFFSMDHQDGVSCFVYRNEIPAKELKDRGIKSSDMVREAMQLAWQRWPGERLYTYVNGKKVKSTNPGCCFKKAGWRKCGESSKGLVIFEAVA